MKIMGDVYSIDDKINHTLEEKKQNNRTDFIDILTHETNVPTRMVNAYYYNWYKIGDDWYFFKEISMDWIIHELLGEIISKYFNIDTVHYKLVKYNNEYGVLSKNFCDSNYKYKTLVDYGLPRVSKKLEIFDSIKKICKDNIEYKNLIDTIKRIIIRDYYVSEYDRCYHNFMFKEGKTITLSPLYDYERSFMFEPTEEIKGYLANFSLNDEKIRYILQNDDLFQELFIKIMDANMGIFLMNLEYENNFNFTDNELAHYIQFDRRIKKIVRKSNIIR